MRRNVLRFAYAYLKHWLLKEDRYSQQSPFIFSVYQGALDCLKKEVPSTKEEKIALLHAYFFQITPANRVLELGIADQTGSRHFNQIPHEKIYRIPATASLAKGIEVILQAIVAHQTLDFVLIHSQFKQYDLQKVLSHVMPRMHPQGILFLMDIYKDEVMNSCWKKIQADTQITLSLDFFDFGVAFLSYSGEKTKLYLSY